jgi:hypothetical protein
LRLADEDPTTSMILPSLAERKGATLEFDAVTGAPKAGFPLILGQASSDQVTHIASGVDAVATTVEAKLRERTSTADFGQPRETVDKLQFCGVQKEGAYIETLGYSAAGDGGGGVFYWNATSTESDNSGTIIKANSVTVGRWIRVYSGALNVRWFGAKGDGVSDDTVMLQRALDLAVTSKQAVYVSAGTYRTTAQLTFIQNTNLGSAYGVTIYGDNSTWADVSTIYAEHTGPSILSLKGTNGCSISGLKFVSHATTFPKTALILGRDVNVDSCGWHNIRRIWIDGMYSKAAIYSIASEENIWSDIFVQLRGGGALYGFYTSTGDVLGVDSLPSSSNIANSITKMHIWNWVNDPNSACIYIEAAQAVGSWSFNDCYCIPKSGSYYQINVGAVDTLNPLGPFTFIGCGGEIYSPISPWLDSPLNAFKISSPGGTIDVIGLTIIASRCQLINAAGTRKILNVSSNISLIKPNIVIQPLEDPSTSYSAYRAKIRGGVFDVADSCYWIPLTLVSPWANTFGSPYPSIAFQLDPIGVLRLRGIGTNGSTAGATHIATLPAGYEPAYNMKFASTDAGVNIQILIQTNGLITILTSGTGATTEVILNDVSFKLID